MGQYFWKHEELIPDGMGFALYGPGHICWLAAIAAAAVLCALFLAKRYRLSQTLPGQTDGTETGISPGKPSSKTHAGTAAAPVEHASLRRPYGWELLLTLLILLAGLTEYGLSACFGFFSIYTLPLHLCSLSYGLCLLHALTRWDWLGEILYFPCLPGAALALLFPDWTAYPLWNYMSIAAFLGHGLVILYIVSELADRRIRPSRRRCLIPILFIAAGAISMYFFDRHFGVNYWFMAVPSPNSPLAGLGAAGYYLCYAALAAAFYVAFYLPVFLRFSKDSSE